MWPAVDFFTEHVDAAILLFIQQNLRVESLHGFFRGVSFLADKGWFWIFLAILLICFSRTRKAGITALCSMLFGLILCNLVMKNLAARPRPFDTFEAIIPLIARPLDYSFPSGHTCASFASAWIYYRTFPHRYGVAALVLAGMIAFSRMYLGVHYPSDIAGGIVVAWISSMLAMRLIGIAERRRNMSALR